MNKLVETPLDDHSRSLCTAVVHKHYSLAQLNFIIAKFSSFILKKQYKYFSLNVSDEIFQSLLKHTPPNTTSEPSQAPSATIPPPSSSMFSKLQILTFASTPFPVLLTNSCQKFLLSSVLMLKLLLIPIPLLFYTAFLTRSVISNLYFNFIQQIFKI